MKKYLVTCILAATLSTGCMSTSDQNAATMDRKAASSELIEKMDEIGYAEVSHAPAVDDVLHSASSILKRQRNVIGMYQKQSEHYRDVQAFLYANKDKEPAELEVAITDFDKGAVAEQDKIGYKIRDYQAASEGIYKENMQLALELTVQLGKAGYLATEYGTEVAKATAMSLAGGLFGDTEEESLGVAILAATDRLELAYDANELIDMEIDTIKAVEALQLELEAKK